MLQVKNLPDELHAALAARSRAQGVTMSDYVTRLLQRDLAQPSVDDWVAERRRTATRARAMDVVHALDAVRAEYAPDAHAPSTSRSTSSSTSTEEPVSEDPTAEPAAGTRAPRRSRQTRA
jgi:post-segregation antitoxin (ccd killing protein)